MSKKYFTESVTEGHPDKICDQISDAIDAILSRIPTAGSPRNCSNYWDGTGYGEITTNCYVDIPKIVRRLKKSATPGQNTVDADTCAIDYPMNSP